MNRKQSFRQVGDSAGGPVDAWHEVIGVDGEVVNVEAPHRCDSDGVDVVSRSILRFPSPTKLEESLGAAGFAGWHRYNDWDRSAVTPTRPKFIVVAWKVARKAGS